MEQGSNKVELDTTLKMGNIAHYLVGYKPQPTVVNQARTPAQEALIKEFGNKQVSTYTMTRLNDIGRNIQTLLTTHTINNSLFLTAFTVTLEVTPTNRACKFYGIDVHNLTQSKVTDFQIALRDGLLQVVIPSLLGHRDGINLRISYSLHEIIIHMILEVRDQDFNDRVDYPVNEREEMVFVYPNLPSASMSNLPKNSILDLKNKVVRALKGIEESKAQELFNDSIGGF